MSVEAGLTIADAARASGVIAFSPRYYELREHRTAVRAQLAGVRRQLAFIDRTISIYEETLHE